MISDKFTADEEVEVAQTIQQLVTQIKTHTGLLDTQSKIYQDKYIDNFEKIKEEEANTHQSVLLPLAEAMEQSEEYSDETYIRKVNSMTVQSIKTMSVSEWLDWAQTKYQVTKQFLNSPLGKKEKVIAILLGYSLDDWLTLKKQDPQAATDLINATSELIEAVGIPTSYTSAALTLFGPFSKFAGKVNTIATKVLAKNLPLNQSGYVKKLLSGIELAKAKLYKIIGKTPPKIVSNNPCFKIKSFSIQAVTTCSFLSFLRDEIINLKQNQSLKRLYQNGGIPINDVLKNSANIPQFKNKLIVAFKEKTQAQELYNALNSSLTTFKNTSVVEIRKVRNFDVYTINLNPFKIGNAINLKNAGMTLSGKSDDFLKASKIFVQQHPELVPNNIKNTLNTKGVEAAAKEFESLRLRWGLTWHHLEDLEGLILVPGRIHAGISHWGANAIISRVASGSEYLKTLWKKMMVY